MDSILSSTAPSGIYKLLDADDFENMLEQLRQQREKLQELIDRDELTGLQNRKAFRETLSHTLSLAERRGRNFALLFIDLDRFKDINDSHGHFVGDEYLKQFTFVVSGVLRESDYFARMGGDEFAILFPDVEDVDHIEKLADKILALFDDPIVINGLALAVSVSIGIACYPRAGKRSMNCCSMQI